ncbi:MAG: rRNA maturation RNase YbeY [Calothrix sp. C42_A2020_038]|nr:rRNA maturation RNase YbeY [Calothrix sp. C42_A2020_038]
MLVELCIQNCFDELDDCEETRAIYNDAQIAPETWEQWFRVWLETLDTIPEAPSYEIALRLTNDTEIQSLNSQYRHQDKSTDVLAFAALEVDCPQPVLEDSDLDLPLYLGDIIISIETANRQAQELGHPLSTELAWLSAHGLLHLLGWDHPDDETLERMLKQQVIMLNRVGISIDTINTN